ncbi:MAG TPA: THUMP domain-containing protein [bacterium]|nr:THUMP domain-containing protein [bacterium]
MNSELNKFGIKNNLIRDGIIYFRADSEKALSFLYSTNVCGNVSLIILKEKISSYDELYRTAKNSVKWDAIFSADKSFMIRSAIISSPLKHSGFASLKLKDAIADYFREKFNKRPDINKDSPDIVIELRVFKTSAVIGINLAGRSLFKRGYRIETNAAPLKETLAAGIAGMALNNNNNIKYKKIIDPMCGSGTIIIESALQIMRIPPQKFNPNFSFVKSNLDIKEYFSGVKLKLDKLANDSTRYEFFAFDNSQTFVDSAKKNIENAGLSNIIKTDKQDFFNPSFDMTDSIIIFNPPHGERMQGARNLEYFYGKIGDTVKKYCGNSAVYIFCPAEENLISKISLKPVSKLNLNNGKIRCNLLEFRIN